MIEAGELGQLSLTGQLDELKRDMKQHCDSILRAAAPQEQGKAEMNPGTLKTAVAINAK